MAIGAGPAHCTTAIDSTNPAAGAVGCTWMAVCATRRVMSLFPLTCTGRRPSSDCAGVLGSVRPAGKLSSGVWMTMFCPKVGTEGSTAARADFRASTVAALILEASCRVMQGAGVAQLAEKRLSLTHCRSGYGCQHSGPDPGGILRDLARMQKEPANISWPGADAQPWKAKRLPCQLCTMWAGTQADATEAWAGQGDASRLQLLTAAFSGCSSTTVCALPADMLFRSFRKWGAPAGSAKPLSGSGCADALLMTSKERTAA